MRRFSILFVVLGLISLSSVSILFAQAPAHSIGAGGVILTDPASDKSVTLGPPSNPSAEYTAWQTAGFPSLKWSVPLPPLNNAQAGFIFSGPQGSLSDSVGPPTRPYLPYWLPPGVASIRHADSNTGGFGGAWDYASFGELGIVGGKGTLNYIPKWNISSGTAGNDTTIGNSSLTDDGSAISTKEPLNLICTTESGTNLHSDYAFINFIDAVGSNRGGVVGNNLNDLTGDNVYSYNQDINYFNIASCVANLVLAVAAVIAAFLPTELPICIINSIQAVLSVADAATAIAGYYIADDETRDQLGVAYTSSAGDYAEYLRRADTSEHLSPGDIVGMSNGLISKKTVYAQSVLSISRAPIVLGNIPPKGQEAYYDKVGFLGQVPVKVRGAVNAGDYIIPSGFEDGTGVAISPDAITPDQFTMVVGRAWTSSKIEDIKFVTVAAGLNAKSMSEIISREQAEIDSLKQANIFASEKFDLIAQAMLQTDVTKRDALVNQAQQLSTSSQFAVSQVQQNNGQQNSAGGVPQSIVQQTPQQNFTLQNNPSNNPSKVSPRAPGKSGLTNPSFLSAAQIQQSMTNRVNSYLSSRSDSTMLDKIQKLQSFGAVHQTVLTNIGKIMNSPGSRTSKGERIKQFLMHPDEATNRAIGACAAEVIATMTPTFSLPTNSKK